MRTINIPCILQEKRLWPLRPCCEQFVVRQVLSPKWLATMWLRDWWNIMPRISFPTSELDASCRLDYLFDNKEKSKLTFQHRHFSWQTSVYISRIGQQGFVSSKYWKYSAKMLAVGRQKVMKFDVVFSIVYSFYFTFNTCFYSFHHHAFRVLNQCGLHGKSMFLPNFTSCNCTGGPFCLYL